MGVEFDENELDLLEDLFDYLDIDGPDGDQMFQLYGIFLKDMVKSPIIIGKNQVGFNSKT